MFWLELRFASLAFFAGCLDNAGDVGLLFLFQEGTVVGGGRNLRRVVAEIDQLLTFCWLAGPFRFGALQRHVAGADAPLDCRGSRAVEVERVAQHI